MNTVPEQYASYSKKYKSDKHNVFSCQYHVIFCPKYRRKILTEPYDKKLKELFYQIAEDNDFSILDLEVMPDHVHMIIDCNPKPGIYKCIKLLKGTTSRIMRDMYPELKTRLPSLWTNSNFISTVGSISLDVVKEYINNQKGV